MLDEYLQDSYKQVQKIGGFDVLQRDEPGMIPQAFQDP
jgi:hypothetical protein